MGVSQGGILTIGPKTQEEFLKRGHTLHISLIISQLSLTTPLNTQYIRSQMINRNIPFNNNSHGEFFQGQTSYF